MRPIWLNIYDHAVVPFENDQITLTDALSTAATPLKRFIAGADRQKSDGANHDHRRREGQCRRPGSLHRGARLCTDELKTAFQIGFIVYIPFLVIDLIVASVLMAMGMMMLSPLVVSLPFKLMLFVLIDGWSLTIGTLTTSIRGLGLG